MDSITELETYFYHCPGLISHCLSCLKTFTTVIFHYVGQTPPDVQQTNREKLNGKEHHGKTSFFFIQLSCTTVRFVFFMRKRLLHFLCDLFMYESIQGKLSEAAVHRCSSKQVFLKILNIRKKTPVLESLFKKASLLLQRDSNILQNF